MSYEMNDLLDLVVEQGASDLHLQVGQPPTLRISGSMAPIDGPALTATDTEKLMLSITPDAHVSNVKLNGGADFGFAFGEKARFRVSVLRAKANYGLVLRQIPFKMFGLRDIGLPDKIRELLYRPRGLILVTGPTGSGKSTTLASMVNYINESRDGHIITIEDPIEYYHGHKRCVVTQREVHVDVPNFSEAIRRALRQDPDVILVGEMRDLETIEAAISAAETGHLVFGTLHTNSAAKTVDRIVDAFPANMKDMIRTQLASSLVAVAGGRRAHPGHRRALQGGAQDGGHGWGRREADGDDRRVSGVADGIRGAVRRRVRRKPLRRVRHAPFRRRWQDGGCFRFIPCSCSVSHVVRRRSPAGAVPGRSVDSPVVQVADADCMAGRVREAGIAASAAQVASSRTVNMRIDAPRDETRLACLLRAGLPRQGLFARKQFKLDEHQARQSSTRQKSSRLVKR
jgi:twitching motility protein PilT